MARRKKVGLKVRVSGDTAFVNTTDIRTHFTAVYDRVLEKYPTVVIERNGTPVAVLKPPSAARSSLTVEEF